MRFLIILDASGSELRSTLIRVISELILLRRLKVSVITAKLIVRRYLIQCVLISFEFILGEADVVTLRIEFVGLFCREVLTITSRVVPMVVL